MYLPGLHGKHSAEPLFGAYDPGKHAVRPLTPPAHLKPFSHSTMALNGTLMYDPGGTAAQLVSPSSKFPYPWGHDLQTLALGLSENQLDGHVLHTL